MRSGGEMCIRDSFKAARLHEERIFAAVDEERRHAAQYLTCLLYTSRCV